MKINKQKDCLLINKSLSVFSDKLLAIAYAVFKAKQSGSTNVTVNQFVSYYEEAIKYIINNYIDYRY